MTWRDISIRSIVSEIPFVENTTKRSDNIFHIYTRPVECCPVILWCSTNNAIVEYRMARRCQGYTMNLSTCIISCYWWLITALLNFLYLDLNKIQYLQSWGNKKSALSAHIAITTPALIYCIWHYVNVTSYYCYKCKLYEHHPLVVFRLCSNN
jgi:hypothetical protein